MGFKTPDLVGYKRKLENEKINLQELAGRNYLSETNSLTKKISFKSEINGYDLLKLPSPSPSTFLMHFHIFIFISSDDFRSPLMTWGEIEDTPLRIDNKNYTVIIYFSWIK